MFKPTNKTGYLLVSLINEPLVDKLIIDLPHGKMYFSDEKESCISRIRNMIDLGNTQLCQYELLLGLVPGINITKHRHYIRLFSVLHKHKKFKRASEHSKIDPITRGKLGIIRVLSRKPLFVDEDGKIWSLHQIKRLISTKNNYLRRMFAEIDLDANTVKTRSISKQHGDYIPAARKLSTEVESFLSSIFPTNIP